MRLEDTAISDVKIVTLDDFTDSRGLFFETFDTEKFATLGITTAFVLDAVSQNTKSGTLRGLHYQAPPKAQAKLVRASRGRALDIAVDIRKGSPTFGRHVAVTLSEHDLSWLYIPEGFAHGFCTLVNDTEIHYKLSDHFAPDHSEGILWNDPELGIDWPVSGKEALMSEKDRALPPLSNVSLGFKFATEGTGE